MTDYDSFFVFEHMRSINTGLGFGCPAFHPYVEKMISYYVKDDTEIKLCPVYNTAALLEICPSLVLNGALTQNINNNLFLSTNDYSKFAEHHAMHTWLEDVEHDPSKRKKKRRSKFSKKIQKSLKQYEKFEFVRKHFGEKGEKLYTFFAYDFFDTGLFYLVKRKISKTIKRLRGKT